MSEVPKWQKLSGDAYWARRRGNHKQAVALLLAAINELGHDTSTQCVLLNSLADLYDEMGECDKALEVAQSVVSLRRSIASDDDRFLGGDLMFLAMLLYKGGKHRDCVALAEEGVQVYRRVFGEDHSETQRMSDFLAQARRKLES